MTKGKKELVAKKEAVKDSKRKVTFAESNPKKRNKKQESSEESVDDSFDEESYDSDELSHDEELEEASHEDAGEIRQVFEDSEDASDDEGFAKAAGRSSDSELEEQEEEEEEEQHEVSVDAEALVVNMEEDCQTMSISAVGQRIKQTIACLSQPANKSCPRRELMASLKRDLAHYYGYSDYLVGKFVDLFAPAELLEFLEANEVPRPVTIRANPLKTKRRDLAQALMAKGVRLQPLDQVSPVALQVFDAPFALPSTPEYCAGLFMIQSAASMLPVEALGVQEGERILDMCSAPGGKTTHIASLLRNTGLLVANDASRERQRAVVGNLHRMGITNTIVCCHDGRKLPSVMRGFDRVLLDAPCSGTGVISKDARVKLKRTDAEIQRLSHLQKELLLAAIDACDGNGPGIIVYATCAITVEENEEVIDYALRRRPNVKLIETGLSIGREGFASFRGKQFHPTLRLTRRLYPHVHNMEGFFVAKLRKHGNAEANKKKETNLEDEVSEK